jgi:hypothetical protein
MSATDDFLEGYDERKIEREIARLEVLKEELSLVRRLKALRASQVVGESPKSEPSPAANGKPSTMAAAGGVPLNETIPATRREAIEAVMKSDPERAWRLSEVRATLIARGWLPDTEESNHRLQVAVSRMFKRKQLERPQTGFYKLPPPKQAALEDAAGSEES